MTDVEARPTQRIPYAFAIVLIAAGALGWWAAFNLTLSKIEVLEDPEVQLGCDFSVLVQCGRNLSAWQGEAFGFPNPLIGMGGFVAPIAVGVVLLAGARLARWCWIAFHVGIAGALAFVVWLIGQSIYSLGTLCPWCMVVWLATIPLFWVVTAQLLAEGIYGERPRRFGAQLRGWVIPVVVVSYAVVVLLAQLELDALSRL